MADPSLYTYPSPLEGFENLPPLPEYVPFCASAQQILSVNTYGLEHRDLTMAQREERRWKVLCESASSQTQHSVRILRLTHHE